MTSAQDEMAHEPYLPAHQNPQCAELKILVAMLVAENAGLLSRRHQADALVAAAADLLRANRGDGAHGGLVPSCNYIAGMFTRYWVEGETQDQQYPLFKE